MRVRPTSLESETPGLRRGAAPAMLLLALLESPHLCMTEETVSSSSVTPGFGRTYTGFERSAGGPQAGWTSRASCSGSARWPSLAWGILQHCGPNHLGLWSVLQHCGPNHLGLWSRAVQTPLVMAQQLMWQLMHAVQLLSGPLMMLPEMSAMMPRMKQMLRQLLRLPSTTCVGPPGARGTGLVISAYHQTVCVPRPAEIPKLGSCYRPWIIGRRRWYTRPGARRKGDSAACGVHCGHRARPAELCAVLNCLLMCIVQRSLRHRLACPVRAENRRNGATDSG